MKKGFTAGLLLVLLSAWPLFLMAREVLIGRNLRKSFQLTPHYDDQAEIGKTKVQLIRIDKEHLVSDSPIRVKIGGRDYSVKSYASSLITVNDKAIERASLAVVQYLGGDGKTPFEKQKMHWRILWVSADGRIREEAFKYAERCEPPVRFMLANFATPTPIGCKSDLMQVWPSLIYPIFYPWISGALGALLVVIFGTLLICHNRRLVKNAIFLILTLTVTLASFAATAEDPLKKIADIDQRVAKDHSEYDRLSDLERQQLVAYWTLHDSEAARWGLIRATTDSKPMIQSMAITLLGHHCNDERETHLIALLKAGKSPTGDVIKALGECKSRKAAPVLLQFLGNDSQRGLASVAATALGKAGIKEAIPDLRKAMASDDRWLSVKSAQALAMLGDPSAREVALRWLNDASPDDVRASPRKWMVQEQAASALAFVGSRDDLKPLRDIVKGGLGSLGWAASRAVIQIMDREGLTLSDWNTDPTSHQIVLGAFPQSSFGWKSNTIGVTQAALDQRRDQIARIEKVTGAPHSEIFRAYMRDPTRKFGRRLAAQQAIWEIGNVLDPGETRSLLEELLTDPDPEIVGYAKDRLLLLKGVDAWSAEAMRQRK